MRLSILIKLFFVLLPCQAYSADDLVIYSVKYRPPEELIKVAEPIFFGKATFSSLNEKIVISAPPKTSEAVLKLFAEMDQKPRMYRISVRVSALNSREQEGVAVRAGNKVKAEKSTSSRQLNDRQEVQVSEGKQAALLKGSNHFPGGFSAVIRSAGEQFVNLTIHQKESDANPAASLSSELRVRLNLWQTIGRIEQAGESADSELLGRHKGQNSARKEIQVKIETVR